LSVKKSGIWPAVSSNRCSVSECSERDECWEQNCTHGLPYPHTRHGRSRAQHVRHREADVEGAKNWRLVHLRRSKGEARRAEPKFGLCFRAKATKDRNGEARNMRNQFFDPGFLFDFYSDRGSTATPSARSNVSWCGLIPSIFFLQIWSPMDYRSRSVVVLPSIVLCRAIALQQSVFPPTRALILCATDRKSLKMTDFSKTGSRNMAETCAINFLTQVSYLTSVVIEGLRRLLPPVLMWAGVDLEYFRAETACWSFRGFSKFDHHGVS